MDGGVLQHRGRAPAAPHGDGREGPPQGRAERRWILVVEYSEVKSTIRYRNSATGGSPTDATDVDFVAGYIDFHDKTVFPLADFWTTPGLAHVNGDVRLVAALDLVKGSKLTDFLDALKQQLNAPTAHAP